MSSPVDLTFVTATLPEREAMVAELGASMVAQTVPVVAWASITDVDRIGPAPLLNRLVGDAQTTWVHRVDDDDLLDPGHVEALAPFLVDDWDVVYSWGRIDPPSPQLSEGVIQRRFDERMLRVGNFIPSCAAVRRSLWLRVGGLRDEVDEDYGLWLRLLDVGARFRCVERVTWTYRLGGDWPHRSTR